MSELPAESLMPNVEEEIETLRRSLERSDTIVNLRNQEIATLNSRLAAKDEIIAETGEQSDRLEQEVIQLRSDLSDLKKELAAPPTKNPEPEQKSAPDVEFPEAAEVYNQFKAENPKTKATYKEVVAILARAQAMIEKS